MQRVHFIDGIAGDEEGKGFDPSRDMELLEAAAQKLPAPRLLIVDPIVSAVAGDSHKNAETRRALQPIVSLAARLGCVALGITHFTKGTAGRDPVERITGSLAFAALARVVLVAAKPRPEPGVEEEPARLFLRAKSNIGPDDGGFAYALERVEVAPDVEGQCVAWGEPLKGAARELLGDAEGEPRDAADYEADDAHSATDEAIEFLRNILSGSEPMLGREVKRLMLGEGYGAKVTRTAREKLGVNITRAGAGKDACSHWALPLVPSIGTGAHSCPQESEGTSGHEYENEGTSDAGTDDAEVL